MRWLLVLFLANVAWAGENTMPGERAVLPSTCRNTPPFFCVGGKPGGQTLTCGTQSGDSCTFNSTSHATKGAHKFGTAAVIDEAGKCVGVGQTTCSTQFDGVIDGGAGTIRETSYAGQSRGKMQRADGTKASPTAVQSGETIGGFDFCGHDGTNFCGFLGIADANVVVSADGGNFTTSSHPTQMCFATTASGSTVAANNLCVRQGGGVETVKTVTKYNNIATVSNGVPSELATIDTTGLTANVASTLLYAVPSSGAGLYRVSALVVETTAGSVSSTLANVQIIYTDKDIGSGTVTIDATPVLGVAGIGQTGALTANTVGTTSSGVIVIDAKASTNINYQTVNYASTAAGMTYALHIKLEAL